MHSLVCCNTELDLNVSDENVCSVAPHNGVVKVAVMHFGVKSTASDLNINIITVLLHLKLRFESLPN